MIIILDKVIVSLDYNMYLGLAEELREVRDYLKGLVD